LLLSDGILEDCIGVLPVQVEVFEVLDVETTTNAYMFKPPKWFNWNMSDASFQEAVDDVEDC